MAARFSRRQLFGGIAAAVCSALASVVLTPSLSAGLPRRRKLYARPPRGERVTTSFYDSCNRLSRVDE